VAGNPHFIDARVDIFAASTGALTTGPPAAAQAGDNVAVLIASRRDGSSALDDPVWEPKLGWRKDEWNPGQSVHGSVGLNDKTLYLFWNTVGAAGESYTWTPDDAIARHVIIVTIIVRGGRQLEPDFTRSFGPLPEDQEYTIPGSHIGAAPGSDNFDDIFYIYNPDFLIIDQPFFTVFGVMSARNNVPGGAPLLTWTGAGQDGLTDVAVASGDGKCGGYIADGAESLFFSTAWMWDAPSGHTIANLGISWDPAYTESRIDISIPWLGVFRGEEDTLPRLPELVKAGWRVHPHTMRSSDA
jgi:hypothetical protein